MAQQVSTAIVDTYAIMADLTGQAPRGAVEVLDDIRMGRIEGIIHYLIIYELSYHWRKNRLPFASEAELLEFIHKYFTIITIDERIALEASKVKIIGDKLLLESGDPGLKHRRLSIADSATIALAEKTKLPIITGDMDLSFVAERLGLKVIW